MNCTINAPCILGFTSRYIGKCGERDFRCTTKFDAHLNQWNLRFHEFRPYLHERSEHVRRYISQSVWILSFFRTRASTKELPPRGSAFGHSAIPAFVCLIKNSVLDHFDFNDSLNSLSMVSKIFTASDNIFLLSNWPNDSMNKIMSLSAST